MGTNVTPILVNCTWLGWNTMLKEKCKTDPKLKWPVLFKRFIDDSFGIIDGNKLDFEYWVSGFNSLQGKIVIREVGFICFPKRREQIHVRSDENYEGILNYFSIHTQSNHTRS